MTWQAKPGPCLFGGLYCLTLVAPLFIAAATRAADLEIDECHADKLLYKPGESAAIFVVLANHTPTATKAQVTVSLVRELMDRTELPTQEVMLPANARKGVKFEFTASGHFGVEAQARATAGDSTAAARDYFSVAENFFDVGIGSTWGAALHTGRDNRDDLSGQARRIYSNWFELFFWAPCDWSQLVSPLDRWWSGQASYPENERKMLQLIRNCHRRGIRVAAYASCNPAGPFGWQVARRHPEMFRRNTYGALDGVYNVEHLDLWNNSTWREKPRQTGWYRINLDLRRADTLDWGIDQVIASAKHYGWDAIRFDGHYTVPGYDEISTRNMRRLKERVAREAPGLRLGYNYGRAPEWKGGVTHEMREAMAGGGLYLQEGLRNWRYTDQQYETWSHYAQNELRVAKQVQAMGGSYHCILGSDPLPPPTAYYKLVYTLIAGGHPFYGEHAKTVGCPNWGAFLTRWSAMLWDLRLTKLDNAEELFSVEPGMRVEWSPLAQQRIVSDKRKFVVLHLVNPPADNRIAQTSFPDAIDTVRVKFRPRPEEQVKRVVLIRPDQEKLDLSLSYETGPGEIRVTVPRIAYWGMLVWELEGAFQPPAEAPPFTESPDQAQVELATRGTAPQTSADPNQRAPIETRPNTEIWETNSGFTGYGVKSIAAEPDAADGLAQSRTVDQPTSMYPFLGRPYIGPIPAGKYRVGVRLKRTTKREGPGQVRFRVHDHRTDKELAVAFIQTQEKPQPPGAVYLPFAESGVYADYSLDIELRQAGLIQVSVWPTGDQAPCTLQMDHIEIETLEPFRDALLAEWNAVERPDGLRTPNGANPTRSLLVAGLYWQQYYLSGKRFERRYELPDAYQPTYKYDLIVLCNVDVRQTSYKTRKILFDWVRDGGRLVVLGGMSTLGQGGMVATYFEDLLPFQLRGSNEVISCEPPLTLGLRADEPLPDAPRLFWRHDLTLDPQSQVLAFAGSVPVLARRDVGHGHVFAFAGTVLGEGDAMHRPFWETASWRTLWEMVCGDQRAL